MLIEIQLQDRGQVITERRVRLIEAEAHRVYNMLQELLLSETQGIAQPEQEPAQPDIETLMWAIRQKDKQILEFSDEINRRGEWLSDATASEAEQVDVIGSIDSAIHNVNAILRRRRKINSERDTLTYSRGLGTGTVHERLPESKPRRK